MSVDVAIEQAPVVSDYIPGAIGHVVVAVGHGRSQEDAVAVWLLSPTGQPTGAWVLDAGPKSDAEEARQLLGMLNGRSVVSWDRDTAGAALERLGSIARVAMSSGWEKTMVRLPDLLVEVSKERRKHADAVVEYQSVSGAKSRLAPLTWAQGVPANVASIEELARIAGLGRPNAGSEVAAEALHMGRLVAWIASLWHETEQVRARRRYLVERFGPARPLPPAWLAQLREAYANPAF